MTLSFAEMPLLARASSTAAARRPVRLPFVLVGGGLVALLAVVTGNGGIALGVVVLVPLVGALVRRPQRGVLVLVALAPFDNLLDLLPQAGTLHAWKEVLVGAVLVATFVTPATSRAAKRRSLPGWTPAVVALIALGLVSAGVVGVNQGLTGLRIEFFYVLLAVAIWRCPLGSTERDRMVTLLMVNGAVNAVAGLAEEVLGGDRLHAIGFPYNTTIRYAGGNILRAFGTFSYQSPLAYFLMVVVLIGLSQILREPGRLRNRLFVASLPLLLASLLFTFERGAFIGLAVGCIYLGVRRRSGIFLAAPVVLLVPLYLPAGVTKGVLSASSLGERASGWTANLHQVLLHPLGAGIGATGAAATKVAIQAKSAAPAVSAIYQPDNYYYKTVYELGVIGLWFLVLFFVAAVASCDRAAVRLQGRDGALADGVCAFLLAAVVASFVSTFFEIYPMDLLTWLLLATVATCAPE